MSSLLPIRRISYPFSLFVLIILSFQHASSILWSSLAHRSHSVLLRHVYSGFFCRRLRWVNSVCIVLLRNPHTNINCDNDRHCHKYTHKNGILFVMRFYFKCVSVAFFRCCMLQIQLMRMIYDCSCFVSFDCTFQHVQFFFLNGAMPYIFCRSRQPNMNEVTLSVSVWFDCLARFVSEYPSRLCMAPMHLSW